ncbi:MAG: peptide chain release factor 3 [Planctomycetaceae bacterium]|nr:peptide chain release factor 3 [Planctomycetaceae bacterium]
MTQTSSPDNRTVASHWEFSPLVDQQRQRRRTFAIISHPDAGKTTLTEKLLLFGGSIEIAGAVRGRKSQRSATSDWMELEKQRGISVSSTVLTCEYEGIQVNLLDTPGHHDFSEDTYRTLMAADAAVMVIDLAKGVETQTEKLFKVCALRKIPVLTFVNKVDREGMTPLAVLDEIERKFSISTVPINWPIGTGADFCGFVELAGKETHLFPERNNDRRIQPVVMRWEEFVSQSPEEINLNLASHASQVGFSTQSHAANLLKPEVQATVYEDVELIADAGNRFERDAFLAGLQSPVFFGSALTNMGVEYFLKNFLKLCPPPGDRLSNLGMVSASRPEFAGFVFKVQANLDPRHRDRVAFARVCSGQFVRDMEVTVARSGKKIRLPRALRIFGQDRQTMDEAYPGDVIGLVCPGAFQLGDTLFTGEPLYYEALPQFTPEYFASLECKDTSRRKQFDRGLSQLVEEGAVQIFHDTFASSKELILAAVGELQFDVVRFRLESEYGVPTQLNLKPFGTVRWITAKPDDVRQIKLPFQAKLVKDQLGYSAVLLKSEWEAQMVARDNPSIKFDSIRVSTFEQLAREAGQGGAE